MSDKSQSSQPEAVSPTAETVSDLPVGVSPTEETQPELARHSASIQGMGTTRSIPTWPPAQQSYRRRPASPTAATILLIVLALLLILGGLGFIIYSTTVQYRSSLHTIATVVVQSTKHTLGTAQAREQGTAQALSTAQANIDATATTQANNDAMATATVDNVTATASALGDLYTQSTSGTPTLDDTLSDNKGDGKWDEGSGSTNTGCTFQNGAYHVGEAQQGYFQPCFAQASKFSNFAYQVHIIINKGGNRGQAGLLFRANITKGAYYFFHLGADGAYALDVYGSNGQVKTLVKGFSTAIHTGLGESNQLAVIARSDQCYLYANGQYVDAVTDSTLSSGSIGVAVIDNNTPIDVEFSDAQVWKL